MNRYSDREFVRLVSSIGWPSELRSEAENIALAREIANAIWPTIGLWMSDKAVLAKVKAKLRQPDVKRAIGDAFAACGFTPADAVAMHIRHINGFERQVEVLDKDGVPHVEIVSEKQNYQALKDYEDRVFPKEVRESRVRVDSRQVQVHVDGGTMPSEMLRGGPPPTRHRLLDGSNVSLNASSGGHND